VSGLHRWPQIDLYSKEGKEKGGGRAFCEAVPSERGKQSANSGQRNIGHWKSIK